jgi:IclR family KDG regulon transcriptional repressor
MRVVPALDRGLQILELVAGHDGAVKVTDISTALGIPRSATYELVHTLKARDYLGQDRSGGLTLGARLFALGSQYGQTLDLTHIAQDVAIDLRDVANETVQVGTLEGRHVLYIARADPSRMVRLVSAVGRRLPAHCTAIGKAMLAQLSAAQVTRCLDGAVLESFTPQSITEDATLRSALDQIRAEGLARDDRESNPEIKCVAAPVFDGAGHCVAAISISVPHERMTDDYSTELAAIVRAGARGFSARLGHVDITSQSERTPS